MKMWTSTTFYTTLLKMKNADTSSDIDYTITKLLVVRNADTNYTFCRLVFTTPKYIFTLHFYYLGRQNCEN